MTITAIAFAAAAITIAIAALVVKDWDEGDWP